MASAFQLLRVNAPFSDMTVVVYAEDCEYDLSTELYEDDGVSLKYRDGECALTEITCKDGKVEIGERVGTYDGMPEKQTFTIVRECIEE